MFGKLFNIASGTTTQPADKVKMYERMLIQRESEIGGKLFGPTPINGRREFFCLDEHTWIWHEEWMDKDKIRRSRTTRYEIRPTGIVKAQDGKGYQLLSDHETKRFSDAVDAYLNRVQEEIYQAV